jgi:hypothetical protein
MLREVPKAAVTLEVLRQRVGAAGAVYVPDAFGEAGGVWVRGYSTAELSKWREASRLPDKGVDVERLQLLQAAAVVLGSADGPPLFAGETGNPSAASLVELAELVPPGVLVRLVAVSDALAGFETPEGKLLGNYRAAGLAFGHGAATGSEGSQPRSKPPTGKSQKLTETT